MYILFLSERKIDLHWPSSKRVGQMFSVWLIERRDMLAPGRACKAVDIWREFRERTLQSTIEEVVWALWFVVQSAAHSAAAARPPSRAKQYVPVCVCVCVFVYNTRQNKRFLNTVAAFISNLSKYFKSMLFIF